MSTPATTGGRGNSCTSGEVSKNQAVVPNEQNQITSKENDEPDLARKDLAEEPGLMALPAGE
jgi:hypothetical protein